MKQLVLRFGLASGFVLGGLTAIMLPLCFTGVIDFAKSEVLGYSAMVAAFLFVFFGIRAYREEVSGGSISFGKAFQVGILITLVTCAFYVVAWEIIYWGFFPDFLDLYQARTVETMRAAGESAAAIRASEEQMARFAELYQNPLFNVAVTFLEVFPVGLIVTLVSAAILRRRVPPPAQPSLSPA